MTKRKDYAMASTAEIESRIAQSDAARSARRAAAAKRVGELAQRLAGLADQRAELEREIGDVLVEAGDVIGVDELAQFTDVPASDLTQWLDGRRTARHKRRRTPASPSAARRDGTGAPSTSKTTTVQAAPATPAGDVAARIPSSAP